MGTVPVSGRDRAVLRAVAAGRCELGAGCEPILLVDGIVCADFSVAQRLIVAGLLAAPDPALPRSPAALTAAGREVVAPAG
ncbi:hypothetical protein [Pseudonocardia nigra]|uniref:hypothetical protein n=1 Tax=Pseudonocardia nigra TaxID=1921578 RepID=UPI0027E29BDC|nr:hypothetical protein [Pseudonocardia nigra]